MAEVNKDRIQTGDWVSGTSIDDERIRGYVEAIQTESGYARIRVTESDHAAVVYRTVESHLTKLELLSTEGRHDESSLQELIEVALAARDEQWFMELSDELKLLRMQAAVKEAGKMNTSQNHKRKWINRLQ